MSYEFYIMSGIAVFVGCTWLYRKGKGAYMMVRKIRSAFKVVNINPASSLADEQYKKLAVGALYASQQGVYQNSIKTGIDYELPQILGEWWGIKNSQDAREKMDYLLEKGFRYYFPYVWQAFLLSDSKQQDEVFQQYMESQEDYDKAVSQLQNLEETYDELIENKVISSKEDLKRYGVAGWDAGRVCFLARACCEMCYITEEEAWQYIDRAYDLVHREFASWHDLAIYHRALNVGRKEIL